MREDFLKNITTAEAYTETATQPPTTTTSQINPDNAADIAQFINAFLKETETIAGDAAGMLSYTTSTATTTTAEISTTTTTSVEISTTTTTTAETSTATTTLVAETSTATSKDAASTPIDYLQEAKALLTSIQARLATVKKSVKGTLDVLEYQPWSKS